MNYREIFLVEAGITELKNELKRVNLSINDQIKLGLNPFNDDLLYKINLLDKINELCEIELRNLREESFIIKQI